MHLFVLTEDAAGLFHAFNSAPMDFCTVVQAWALGMNASTWPTFWVPWVLCTERRSKRRNCFEYAFSKRKTKAPWQLRSDLSVRSALYLSHCPPFSSASAPETPRIATCSLFFWIWTRELPQGPKESSPHLYSTAKFKGLWAILRWELFHGDPPLHAARTDSNQSLRVKQDTL